MDESLFNDDSMLVWREKESSKILTDLWTRCDVMRWETKDDHGKRHAFDSRLRRDRPC